MQVKKKRELCPCHAPVTAAGACARSGGAGRGSAAQRQHRGGCRAVVGGGRGSLPVAANKAQGWAGGVPTSTYPPSGQCSTKHPSRPPCLGPKWLAFSGCCHVEISWGETLHPFPCLVSMVIFHSTVFSRSEFISLQIRQPMLIYRSLGSISWQQAEGSYH